MSEIEALAAVVRAGLDADEAAARKHLCALDCLRHTSDDWHRVHNERGRGSTMNALRSVGLEMLGSDWPGKPEGPGHSIHYVGMRGTAMDPARVLADVASLRALVDALLAEPHAIPYGPCPMSAPTEWEPHERRCTCGRDARVAAYLTLLARPYQTTQEGA